MNERTQPAASAASTELFRAAARMLEEIVNTMDEAKAKKLAAAIEKGGIVAMDLVVLGGVPDLVVRLFRADVDEPVVLATVNVDLKPALSNRRH